MVTSAQTSRLAPAASAPVVVTVPPTVEQLAEPPSARNTTDQPAGSAGGVTPAAVVAANVVDRLKLSETKPVLFTYNWKREVVVPAVLGVTTLVVITVAPVAPKPVVAALPALAVPAGVESERAVLLVTSTVLAATSVSVSITSSNTVLLNTEVARLVIEYGPPLALDGSVTFATTL